MGMTPACVSLNEMDFARQENGVPIVPLVQRINDVLMSFRFFP